jgi:NitT/TauT family transport system substrate-binding protein
MTGRGKFVLTLLILAIAGFGAYKWWDRLKPSAYEPASSSRSTGPGAAASGTVQNATQSAAKELEAQIVEPLLACPVLEPAGTYVPKDNIIDIELSEYPGYAGLVVANGGLEPSENSVFFRKHGFKVRIKLSEEESWSALNAGRMAASATTVDVLATHCRSLQATVPLQIGYSRGADGIVVRKDIRRINDLKGRVLVTAQFTEADFFLRYLTQEAGLSVKMLSNLTSQPDPEKVNVVYASDAFAAGDLFLKDLQSGSKLLAGCVTWAPKTTEVIAASAGGAHMLTTNKNLLIIADVLVVNRGFAAANPKIVAGLTEGILTGNNLVRENANAHLDLIARAFKWSRDEARDELAKVHFSNFPENQAFFSGAIDAAGSFSGIYQSAILAYGAELIKDPLDPDRFADTKHLQAIEKSGVFANQVLAIAPIRSSSGGAIEGDPLLSKDIRFLFEPNSAKLDLSHSANIENLNAIKRLLQVSPGSTILLRGHVDNALIEKFRQQGGEPFVRQMALKAMELSKNRAAEIRRVLVEQQKADPARLETVGRGWEEPAGPDPEKNRRVEVQWFTVE